MRRQMLPFVLRAVSWFDMSATEPVRFNVSLSTSAAQRLDGLVSASGLKRATLARLVLEHFLRHPDPGQLFETHRDVDPAQSPQET